MKFPFVYVSAAEATTIPVSVSWTKSATLSLLQFVKDKQLYLKDKITKNKIISKDIALLLQTQLPGVTPGQCNQKWHNLEQQYKRYVDNSNKTWRGKMVRPDFAVRSTALIYLCRCQEVNHGCWSTVNNSISRRVCLLRFTQQLQAITIDQESAF